MRPVEIKDVIKEVVAHLSRTPAKSTKEDLERWWGEAVGPKAARHTKIKFLKNSRLYVGVDSSVWLYELSMQKEKIVQKLEVLSGKRIVGEIIFRTGEI